LQISNEAGPLLVWRHGVVVPSQKAGIGRGVNKRMAELKSALPAADPPSVRIATVNYEQVVEPFVINQYINNSGQTQRVKTAVQRC
jgi:hypothetical protein